MQTVDIVSFMALVEKFTTQLFYAQSVSVNGQPSDQLVLPHFAQSHFAQSYFAQSRLLTITPNPNPLGEMGLGEMGLGEMGGHRSTPPALG